MTTSKRLTCLTISIIVSNINKANRLLDDMKYCKPKVIQNGYVEMVANTANIKDGMPCMRCKEYIKPFADCYVKYRHNNTVSVPTYYHNKCFERLFQ